MLNFDLFKGYVCSTAQSSKIANVVSRSPLLQTPFYAAELGVKKDVLNIKKVVAVL